MKFSATQANATAATMQIARFNPLPPLGFCAATIHVGSHESAGALFNVLNVIDQRCSGVAGMLCCHFQRASSRIT